MLLSARTDFVQALGEVSGRKLLKAEIEALDDDLKVIEAELQSEIFELDARKQPPIVTMYRHQLLVGVRILIDVNLPDELAKCGAVF